MKADEILALLVMAVALLAMSLANSVEMGTLWCG